MNIREFQLYMQSPPASVQRKYIFFVNSEELAMNIAYCGYGAQAIINPPKEGFFTADSFVAYMHSLDQLLLEGRGTDRIQYVYVPACRKDDNDRLIACLKEEGLEMKEGWQLFKDKAYLSRVDKLPELQSVLANFVKQMEGPDDRDVSLMRFHTFSADGRPSGIFDAEIVDYLSQEYSFIVVGGTPYIYQNGVYREDRNGCRLRGRIRSLMYREFQKAPLIKRVYDQLIDQTPLQKTMFELNLQPKHWINFQNGYLDVKTWTMQPHDPKYLTMNQIPYQFDPLAVPTPEDGQHTVSFLKMSLPDLDDQETFWEFLGYSMTSDTRFQKFVMIKGPGGTGKSVLIALMEHIIGEANCANVSLQDLNKRFYATSLFGVLLNACADIPSTAMQSVDVLKKAVGEDLILYERKGHDPMKFFSYAKLIFSANEMPMNLDDKTNAYYRRMLVLEMNHIVTPEEKDMDLKDKLFEETSFCIYRAVVALKELYRRGEFPESPGSREAIEELHRSADSVKAFLDERVEEKEDSREKRSDTYEAYCKYCHENDRQAHGKSIFFRYMKDKGYVLKRYSTGFWYMGIRLKNPDDDFVEADPDEENPFEIRLPDEKRDDNEQKIL